MSQATIAALRHRVQRLLALEDESRETFPADSLEGLEEDIRTLETELRAPSPEGSHQNVAEALRERVMLHTAVDAMIEGVIVTNMEGRVAVFNAAARSMLGRGPSDARPDTWSGEFGLFLVDGETPFPSGELPLTRALNGEDVDDVELIIRTPEQPVPRHVSSSARPVIDKDDHQIGAVVVFHDVTDTKVVERELREARDAAEAADQAKTNFLANMSHEIRTPLTAVLGFADLLLDPALDESKRLNYSQAVRRSGEHLLALINDILDLSKINSDQVRVESAQFSLPNLILDAASVMRVRAHDKNVGFELAFETPVPETMHSDPMRVRQILLNLLSNAVKFTDEGRVRLAVACRDVGTDRARVVFAVEDTGVGMNSEQIESLFQPFYQASPSMTRRHGGTGLGLSICHSLASMLGGEIEVTSRPGEGSIFTFSLYQAIDEQTSMVNEPGEHVARGESIEGPETVEQMNGRVLLAEDGADNQVLIATILRRHGLEVTIAGDGEAAVEQALAADTNGAFFDAILMDMQMPRLDGYGATARLRSRGYSGPIIALTAHAMQGEHERCLAAGCDDYLSKPIDRPDLLTTLAFYMHRFRGTQPEFASAATVSTEQPEQREEEDSVIYSHYRNDPDMEELIAGFVERLPFHIQDIRAAMEAADLESVRRLAHQLKGAAGGYGFSPVSEAAETLEKAARDAEQAGEVADEVERLDAICGRVRHDG